MSDMKSIAFEKRNTGLTCVDSEVVDPLHDQRSQS